MIKQGELKAVLDEDLEKYLKSLGCLELVNSGEAHCLFCGNTISEENLHSIFPLDGIIQFCCHKFDCKTQLSMKGRVINDSK